MELLDRNAEMRDFFASRCDVYDSVHEEYMPTKTLLTDALPADTCRILDIGAGTGLELFAFFSRFPNAMAQTASKSPGTM